MIEAFKRMPSGWAAGRIAGLIGVAALTGAGAVHAGSCSVSATPMTFSNYLSVSFAGKLSSQDRTSDATVVLNCVGINGSGSYSIALGADATGSFSPRRMTTDASPVGMAFNIFTDTANTVIWGDGVSGGLLQGSLAAGDSRTPIRVYGRIPGGQSSLSAGVYSAALSVMVSYDP